MNFQGKAVLVYLEEDNIARAYFRVQPLMTQDGPIGPVNADYPDDGFLRIVPDKIEQHTFKERMRTLIGLCLVDLRFFPLDANKIRTNKNYSPSRGETNQFIVYSDAVRSLPDDLVYQVVGENEVKNASTPLVYIRNGANIQGPFRREDGQSVGETAQLPPDSGEIHSLTVNGQRLVGKCIGNHKGNEFFGEMIRTIVVGTTADCYRKTVCSVICKNKQVSTSL